MGWGDGGGGGEKGWVAKYMRIEHMNQGFFGFVCEYRNNLPENGTYCIRH